MLDHSCRRETTDDIIYVAAKLGRGTLESFAVSHGGGFGEESNRWAKFHGAVCLSEGAGEVDVMF